MNNNNNKDKKRKPQFSLTWLYVIIAIALGYMLMKGDNTLLEGSTSRKATYTQFKTYVEQGYASRIVVNKKAGSLQMYIQPSHIRDIFKDQKVDSTSRHFVVVQFPSADKLDDFISQQEQLQHYTGETEWQSGEDENSIMRFFWSFGPFLLIVVFWIFLMRRMNGGNNEGGGPMG